VTNEALPVLPKINKVERGKVVTVSTKLGTPEQECPQWLIATPKEDIPQPERLAFTACERAEDGSFIIPRPVPVEPKAEVEENHQNKNLWGINNHSSLIRKRPLEQTNGVDAVTAGPLPSKRRQLAPPGLLANKVNQELYGLSPRGGLSANGRPKVATITRIGGRKQMISWVDAPDDVFFVATDTTKRFRRQLTASELRSGARRPWKRVSGKNIIHHTPSINGNGLNNGNGNLIPDGLPSMMID
jgi:metastasis-associated protein MTA